MSFQNVKLNKKTGFTLVEILVAFGILGLIFAIVAYWFSMQKQYQSSISSTVIGSQNINLANWKMTKELKFARNIIYPRINSDGSIHSSNKIIFKDFAGEIICFYYDKNTKEIKRLYIGNKDSQPKPDLAPIAQDIDEVYFTNLSSENRILDIYMKSGPAFGLETVYMVNE